MGRWFEGGGEAPVKRRERQGLTLGQRRSGQAGPLDAERFLDLYALAVGSYLLQGLKWEYGSL